MSLEQVLDILTRWVLPYGLFLAGIMYAAMHWSRHPRVSLLVIIVCATVLGMWVLSHLLRSAAPPYSGAMILHWIMYALEKLCFIALGFAAIMGRKAPAADTQDGRALS